MATIAETNFAAASKKLKDAMDKGDVSGSDPIRKEWAAAHDALSKEHGDTDKSKKKTDTAPSGSAFQTIMKAGLGQ